MEIQKYIKEYSDKYPVVVVVIVCALMWVFLGFVNRDKQITELENALTNTTNGDYFAVRCNDYFSEENFDTLNQEQIDKVCTDLARTVDSVNQEIISDFHRPSNDESGVCSGRYDTDC